MAPLSGSDNDHTLAQPVPGVGVIHTITLDDAHMARTFFDVSACWSVAVISPAFDCGTFDRMALMAVRPITVTRL